MTEPGHGVEPTLDCLLGRCDSLRAEVFFRAELPPGVAAEEAVLTGTLTGPDCRHAITLPVGAKLAAVPGSPAGLNPAAASTVVARVILTEPSFWTPELPSLYRLEARLVAAGRGRNRHRDHDQAACHDARHLFSAPSHPAPYHVEHQHTPLKAEKSSTKPPVEA